MWFKASDDPRNTDETRVLTASDSEELDHKLRQLVIDTAPSSLVPEQQLLTILLALLRSEDDDEGRALAREKLADDDLS